MFINFSSKVSLLHLENLFLLRNAEKNFIIFLHSQSFLERIIGIRNWIYAGYEVTATKKWQEDQQIFS